MFLSRRIVRGKLHGQLGPAVEAVLQELDKTPHQIVALLEGEAIRGEKGSSETCGLAKFFRLRLAGFEGVRVFVHASSVSVCCSGIGRQKLSFRRNRSLTHFVRSFDKGAYQSILVDRYQMPAAAIPTYDFATGTIT